MIPYPHSQKNEASTRPLTRKRLTRKGFSDIVLNSIATLALQLKKFSSSLQRSSGNPRVAVLGEMLQKNLNVSDIFCGSFILVYFLFYISLQFLQFVCIHNIHKHNFQTITPQSFNHTTFKPLYQNHTKINRT